MLRKSALGKGLGALIPDYVNEADESMLQELEVDSIMAGPYQPRINFSVDKLQELANSIKEHGLTQPILVRKKGDKYEIVAGERRYRAIKLLNYDTIPAIVKEVSDQDSLEIALIENLQREDINAIEEAKAYEQLSSQFKLSHDEIAKRLGKSRPAVSNTLRLLELPSEILDAVNTGQITAGHARALLALKINEQKVQLFKKIKDKNMSVRQTEEAVRKMLVIKPLAEQKPIYMFDKEGDIKEKFWKKFTFRGTEKSGRLIFKYSNAKEKEELLQKLGVL